MPPYEITFFFRPLAKANLVDAIKRQAVTLMDKGAVITKLQSLGFRDLPYSRTDKYTLKNVHFTNSVLMDSSMSVKAMNEARAVFLNDKDLLWIGFVNSNTLPNTPDSCDLEQYLLPPAYRPSVKQLRRNQKLSQFTRFKIYKRTESEFHNVPKAYPIAPHKG
uniref:Small ribosomal subunit protein bS6m n=1 Tax=Globodera rostochiensis TaxID=31243 RepID=A0A914H1H8_GLORO